MGVQLHVLDSALSLTVNLEIVVCILIVISQIHMIMEVILLQIHKTCNKPEVANSIAIMILLQFLQQKKWLKCNDFWIDNNYLPCLVSDCFLASITFIMFLIF